MLNIDRQIVNLYEQDACEAQDIAEDLGLEVEAVKACLMQNSTAYRNAVKADDKLFSAEELRRVARALYNIALDDDPACRSSATRAGIFVINEGKGRNDVDMRKDMGSLQVNIMVIQDRLQNMQKVMNRIPSNKIVDISEPEGRSRLKSEDILVNELP